jgi:Xaa-Pro dipeptidase
MSKHEPTPDAAPSSAGLPAASFHRRDLIARGGQISAAALLFGCATKVGEVAPAAPVRSDAASPANTAQPVSAARLDATARLDDLFAHLTDQSGSVAPITSAERAARRQKLGRILAERGADALILEAGPTMTYLAGVSWGKSERFFALVVLADGSHFWVCPAFEESRARLSIDGADGPGGAFVSWQEDEYPYAPIESALRVRRAERVLIEPSLRYIFADRLAAKLGRERVTSGHAAVVALRGRKDAHEIALLRRANELTQLAIREVAATLAPGLTGAEIGARMDRAHEKLGMRGPWNLSLIGPAAALPHGDPAAAPLAKGDVLLIDTGASLHGYQSDNTRTWVFDGAPSSEVSRVWTAVRDAQLRAFEGVRPGIVCKTIDTRARDLITERGFGPGYARFTHRLGHGIGLEGHEDPYFDGASDTVLESGMTLSNEPGIYLPGQFGVRLEDIVVVTDSGADHFGSWQIGPTSPA